MTEFPRGLIVSLTPRPQSPWQDVEDIVRLAAAAQSGGAVAVKMDGPDAVRAVKRYVPGLPVLAVSIDDSHGGVVRITPSTDHAAALVDAGADVIELEADSTARRLDGQDLTELITSFVALGRPVKAGVPDLDDARAAVEAGATMVSSSTMGYPAKTHTGPLPDLALVELLVAAAGVPVIAERGYATPDQVRAALDLGAHAVVVGSAIVDPAWLTARFTGALAGVGDRP
ncbi:N-acetylmannosamine-6-phosphate 2-epimerase [Streptomyces sp. NPDC096142]|uniref:N-acetylmannosamine-6-phosphate 2-epimerase n=1 Tax=Streptomyces sp. NPDC096142 TaxID=3366077 RepID=UPI0037F7FE3A